MAAGRKFLVGDFLSAKRQGAMKPPHDHQRGDQGESPLDAAHGEWRKFPLEAVKLRLCQP